MEVVKIYISDDYFSYDGIDSSRYGLRFAWINSEQDKKMTSKKSYNYTKSNGTNRFRVATSTYESPLEFKIGIIAEKALTEFEVRTIYRKFFNHNQFKKLEFTRYNGEKIHINCLLINPERVEGSIGGNFGIVGFEITVVCDAPWGWTDEIEIIPELEYADIGNGMKEAVVTIFNNSDSHEYVYPEVEFEVEDSSECSATASFTVKSNCQACARRDDCIYSVSDNNSLAKAMIINESDNPETGICVLAIEDSSLNVNIKPATGQILVSAGEVNYGLSQTNKKFLRLVPGENVLSIWNIKQGTLKIRYKEARVFV